jgi:hypothetical protein
VDDYALFCFFMERYGAVRYAKVVLDESGFSKGYGFVRLASGAEQRHALAGMTGVMGLGSKPIKVSMAYQRASAQGCRMPGAWDRPPPAVQRQAFSISPGRMDRPAAWTPPPDPEGFSGPVTDLIAYQTYQTAYLSQQQQYQQAMTLAWQMQQLQQQQMLLPAGFLQQLSPPADQVPLLQAGEVEGEQLMNSS